MKKLNPRQKLLLKTLRGSGQLQIDQCTAKFAVSAMTIRRDLRILAENKLAVIIPGGAALNHNDERLYPPVDSQIKNVIANKLLERIKENSTIMINTGSTALAFARALAASDLNVTVISNSLPVAAALFQSRCQVLLTGGEMRSRYLDLVGPIAEKYLSEYHIEMMVTGCDGLIAGEGFFTSDINLANFERQAVRISDQVVILSDSSKIGSRSLIKFANISDVNTLITDQNISEHDRRMLSGRLELVIADGG